MNTKKVLTHLIRAGRDALHLEKTLSGLGYKETPYFNLYGEICDAIYSLVGEETETFGESVTHETMTDSLTPDELSAETLAAMYDYNALATDMEIPPATLEILLDAADERGIELNKLIKLILSEWAMRKMLSTASA